MPPRHATDGNETGAMFGDVRPREIPGTVRRDIESLYDFYLDEERRARLARMGRLRRVVSVPLWFLRSLLLKLTPTRRALLVVALFLALLGKFSLRSANV